MDGVLKLFKIFLAATVGLLAISILLVFILAPSDQEAEEINKQKVALEREKTRELIAGAKQKLRMELDGNKGGLIEEINELISKGEYFAAHKRAEEFREFRDEDLMRLSKRALSLHEESENAKRRAQEARLSAAFEKLNKNTDKIEGIDWFRDKASPAYNNQNGLFVYFGRKGSGNPWLRLRVQYFGDDWLFIDSFVVVADGQRFEREKVKFERDNDVSVWEWYDGNVSYADMRMIKAVISSKEAVIRLQGRQYHKDKVITASQKLALQNVLDAYHLIGGI